MHYIETIEELKPLLKNAHYVGIKTVKGNNTLEGFISAMLHYRPRLIRLFYRIRAIIVGFIGIKQEPLPDMQEWLPKDLPMLPCGNIWFFTVRGALEDRFWVAQCPNDRHLTAHMGVVAEPAQGELKKFHIITAVRFKHWTGRLYFGLIFPFNLFLVDRMAKSGAWK
jgi:hypothetical protein